MRKRNAPTTLLEAKSQIIELKDLDLGSLTEEEGEIVQQRTLDIHFFLCCLEFDAGLYSQCPYTNAPASG